MKKTGLLSLFLLVALTIFAQNEKKSATIEMPKRKLSVEATAGVILIPIGYTAVQATAGLHYQLNSQNQLGIAYTVFSSSSIAYEHPNIYTKGIGLYIGHKPKKHWKMEIGAGYLLDSYHCNFYADEFVYKRSESINVYGSFSVRRYFLYDYLSIGLNGNFSGPQAFDSFWDKKLVWSDNYTTKSFTLSLGLKL